MSNENEKLIVLTNQYNDVLLQYQTTLDQYIQLLNSNVNSGNTLTDSKTSEEIQNYQKQLQNLNNQLIYINNQIIVVINESSNKYEYNVKENVKIHKILGKNYSSLIKERRDVDEVINQYNSLQQEVDNTDYYTTESYSRYILLLAITIILFFLLFKYAILSNHQNGGGNSRIKTEVIFLLCVMIVFLGLANILKNMNMLIFITVILIVYIFIKIKRFDV